MEMQIDHERAVRGLVALVRSVEAGSFSAAARRLGMTPSAVSKSVAKLESRLGARLFHRGTRALRLTPEGEDLHTRARRILAELEEAQAMASRDAGPRGPVRLTAPLDLGRDWLLGHLPAFVRTYPEVRCELGLTDRFVDLVAERVDVAVRVGTVADERLVRRKIGVFRQVLCAAPAYLARHGIPRTVDKLTRHACLGYLRDGGLTPWAFPGGASHMPHGPFAADTNGALHAAAVAGLGIAKLPEVAVRHDVRARRLRVLTRLGPAPPLDVHLLYAQPRLLPSRVRALIDFLMALAPELA